MEGDGLGLDLALLHIDLVTAKHDGDILADTDEVTYRDILARVIGSHQRETYGASWERSCR